MSLPALLLALTLTADDPIPPEKSAQIERDQAKAQDEVARKFGNKKSSELSQDERRQMIREQEAADKAVLEKAGVDPKQWARESAKRDRASFAQQKELVKDLAEKEKKAAEALKKAKELAKDKEITVQRGISDENPVIVDEKDAEDGTVAVEKGLPPDVESDQAMAAEQDRLENSGAASEGGAKSAPKGGRGGGKRR
jgi:hypothetical protein